MQSVSLIVAVLAMFVALAAVFFASLAMKKTDEAYGAFLRSHIEPLSAEVAEIKATLNKTKKLAEAQQNELATIKEIKRDLTAALRDIEVRINALKESAQPRPARASSWPA